MNQKEIIDAIKLRTKYMLAVGGFDFDSTTISGVIEQINNDAELVSQFEKSGNDRRCEFQRTLIEMCANIILMSSFVENNEFFNNENNIVIKSPDNHHMSPFGNPEKSYQEMIMTDPITRKCVPIGNYVKTSLDEEILLPKKVGKIDDGPLFNGEYRKLSYSQKADIDYLASRDQACINGLTRIITEFDRPIIIQKMKEFHLIGRGYCLGFIAKICKYDIKIMDAIIKAIDNGAISEYMLKHEAIHMDRTQFSVIEIVKLYGRN